VKLLISVLLFSVSAIASTRLVDGRFAELRKIFSGQSKTFKTATVETGVSSESRTSENMVKAYVEKNRVSSPGYRFLWNSSRLRVNETTAGTIADTSVVDVVRDAAEYAFRYDPNENQKISRAIQIVEELQNAGIDFGFDGSENNGCVSPTPTLLVLDKTNGTVYALELYPCRL
jgi:hypothetical protein